MPNYRRTNKSGQYGSRSSAKGVTTLVVTALVIVGVFLGIRFITSNNSSDTPNTDTTDEIQTLESVLRDANVPLNEEGEISGVGGGTEKQVCNSTISRIDTEDNKVALTFDSISLVDKADQMLETLKQENVPAFFFITGEFATEHGDIVQKIVDAGFPIGNHSDTHRDFTTLETSDVKTEISNAETKIETAMGKTPEKFVRPPFNKENTQISQAIRDMGYCPILFSVDAQDWKEESTSDDVIEAVTNSLKPGGIIWMLFGHQTAADALPTIISKTREAGYSFVDIRDYIDLPAQQNE